MIWCALVMVVIGYYIVSIYYHLNFLSENLTIPETNFEHKKNKKPNYLHATFD